MTLTAKGTGSKSEMTVFLKLCCFEWNHFFYTMDIVRILITRLCMCECVCVCVCVCRYKCIVWMSLQFPVCSHVCFKDDLKKDVCCLLFTTTVMLVTFFSFFFLSKWMWTCFQCVSEMPGPKRTKRKTRKLQTLQPQWNRLEEWASM